MTLRSLIRMLQAKGWCADISRMYGDEEVCLHVTKSRTGEGESGYMPIALVQKLLTVDKEDLPLIMTGEPAGYPFFAEWLPEYFDPEPRYNGWNNGIGCYGTIWVPVMQVILDSE